MKSTHVIKAVLASAALFVVSESAHGQEPGNAQDSQPKPAAETVAEEFDLSLSRALLANEIIQLADASALTQANGLGIDVSVTDAALRAQLGLPEGRGLTVTQVPEGSIGAQAGLKVHDIIVQIGAEGVSEPVALAKLLDAADGQAIKLKLWRAGKPAEVEVTPKRAELASVRLWSHLITDHSARNAASEERYRIGVTLSEADDTLRQQLRLATGEGLVVTEVLADSSAARAGVQTHDVLTMLDGTRLTTVEAINAQIQALKDKEVELRLLRSGKELSISITPRKTEEGAFIDQPLVYWDTKSCRSCHVDAAHNALGWKLGANHSVWTDGHHAKLFLRDWATRPQSGETASAEPQQQVEALKSQLAEMQKTLAALEAALPIPSKPDVPQEKND